ncbi:MAG: hypothetical protein ACI9KE_001246 [Polyangiales bacterium]|jgi:hypothetical protein
MSSVTKSPTRFTQESLTLSLLVLLGCGGTHAPSYGGEPGGNWQPSSSTEAAEYAGAESEAPYESGGGGSYAADYGASPPAAEEVASASVSITPAAVPTAEGTTITATTTTTVTVAVDTPSLPPTPAPAFEVVQRPEPRRLLTAATVSDHDRRDNYLSYFRRHIGEAQHFELPMEQRARFTVVDGSGRPVMNATVQVQDSQGRSAVALTHADGICDIHPGLLGLQDVVSVRAQFGQSGRSERVQVGRSEQVTLRLMDHVSQGPTSLDIAFLIDVTGSMEDELRYVNREVVSIVDRIRSESQIPVRIGAVFYRDRSDSVPLQRIQFTTDVQAFAAAMHSVRASGGGDYPEDMNAGFATALDGLNWNNSAGAARVLIPIADAPPQNYGGFDHHAAMRSALQRGIRILPVAASGADRSVEFLFRAYGAVTSTPYVYLTDDSGVGGTHMEADTDRVAVEFFHDVLTRLLVSDVRGEGMHEAHGFEQ